MSKLYLLALTFISFLGYCEEPFVYKYALVRDLSTSFENCIKLNRLLPPINMDLAHAQHKNYVNVLKTLVPEVMRLEGDPQHPDCNFIEDTAVIVGDIVVISRMGAIERQREEIPVAKFLGKIRDKKIVSLQFPALMDGGDILYTGRHLFVGLSKRTNKYALIQLKEIFNRKLEVIGIPVADVLHLKSIISAFDENTLIVADNPAGKATQNAIEALTHNYQFVSVPDPVASNVLRIKSTLLIQDGYPESEAIFKELCKKTGVNLIKLNMSELNKADGALTCDSLLFN